jgi:magnesium-transporting ATPase (P-type)
MPARKLHQLSAAEAFRSLGSSERGLIGAEVARRRGEYGPHRIERVRRRSAVSRFLAEFTHFFAVILWAAAGLAFFAAVRGPGSGMAALGWAIVGVIVVNAVFSFSQEFRAERALERLQELLPHRAAVLRDGAAESAASEDVVPGDVLLLEEGDDVPADARVLAANGLRVNVSTVTGESVPVARDAEVNGDPEPLHASNVVLTGTSVVAGRATAVAYATG